MIERVLIRGWVSDINVAGQKYVRLTATGADGKGFWTDDNSLIPASDVLNPIRCKECKFGLKDVREKKVLCMRNADKRIMLSYEEDGFCSYGERGNCDFDKHKIAEIFAEVIKQNLEKKIGIAFTKPSVEETYNFAEKVINPILYPKIGLIQQNGFCKIVAADEQHDSTAYKENGT